MGFSNDLTLFSIKLTYTSDSTLALKAGEVCNEFQLDKSVFPFSLLVITLSHFSVTVETSLPLYRVVLF